MANLLDKRLLFLTGKGGVGKTTTSAAIARLAAERGKRVLVCEIDTEPYMGRLFGEHAIGFEPTRVAQNIYAASLIGMECMRKFVARFVPGRRVADLIMKNRVARIFFEAAPSVMEAVIFDEIAALATAHKPAFDLVIVDLPASGHAVTFLNVPKSMVEMVRVGELAKRMRTLAELIADPTKTELLLVSLPEEMSVNETLELWQKAKDTVDAPLRSVIVNGARHPGLQRLDYDELIALQGRAPDASQAQAVSRLAYGVGLGLFWDKMDAENIQRLRDSIDGNVVEVPYVFHKKSEPDLVQKVASTLAEHL